MKKVVRIGVLFFVILQLISLGNFSFAGSGSKGKALEDMRLKKLNAFLKRYAVVNLRFLVQKHPIMLFYNPRVGRFYRQGVVAFKRYLIKHPLYKGVLPNYVLNRDVDFERIEELKRKIKKAKVELPEIDGYYTNKIAQVMAEYAKKNPQMATRLASRLNEERWKKIQGKKKEIEKLREELMDEIYVSEKYSEILKKIALEEILLAVSYLEKKKGVEILVLWKSGLKCCKSGYSDDVDAMPMRKEDVEEWKNGYYAGGFESIIESMWFDSEKLGINLKDYTEDVLKAIYKAWRIEWKYHEKELEGQLPWRYEKVEF